MSATVDSITAQTASTTLNDTTPAPAEKPAAENEAVIASAAEGRRLYIGNLAYATTEGELKEFFKEFLVESTSIPTNPRTNRPVGYAFVDLSTPSEAERAISELNGKAILERKVSIQLARKPEAHTEGAEGTNGTKARKDSKKEKPRRSKSAAAKDGAAPTETAPTNDGAEGTTTVNPKAAKTPVPRKQRGPPEDGVPSKTKVMVANLPYDLTEEKEIFIDYQPSSAKIALRPIPRFMVKKLQARNEPRKGRGFGFVTLASEELQQKACAEMNGKEIEGREIAVKVAIDSPGKEDDPEASIEATGEEAPSTAEASGSVEAPTATA
ncbi:RNP domain-containing protein [Pseudovirgaria hyperparasitica]|uniref:RNP domain-containing protein n=1 Tax=Pseudovirgaria hyperparasitica TaxID=470096 RepID=A0A6A6WMM9_9PEZI|nr:RNP domain-containing protein [Pseudovirgaria hyperparasitica]KAF2763464.1 RNP domain-containing protein [Pseudovirgaria hyperparasitica]